MPANITAKTVGEESEYSNVSSSARISQATGKAVEKLFTVRPRYYTGNKDSSSRGKVSTIRVVRSIGRSKDEDSTYSQTMKGFESRAYNKLVDKDGYSDFILQNVQFSLQEKSQVFHSFGGNHSVYFYGENPAVFTINGLVTDDLDNDQYARFMALYQNHLRGSEASRDFTLLELSLPNLTIFGSILGISIQQSADRDTDIGFSLQLIAKSYIFKSTDEFFAESADSSNINDYQDSNFLTASPSQIALVERFKIYQAAKAAKDPNRTATLNGGVSTNILPGYTLEALGLYTGGVDVPESIKDIMSTVDGALDWINAGINTVRTYADFVTGYANLVASLADNTVGYLGKVEATLDNLMNTVGSVVSAVEGAIERVEDAYGSIVNFPESIALKIGRYIENGLIPPDGVALIGSKYVSAEDAEQLLRMQARNTAGPVRGTGRDPAVTTSADDMATLTYS